MTRAAPRITGVRIRTQVLSPAPDASTLPLITGRSRTTSMTPASRVEIIMYAIVSIYRARLIAMTDSCSATFTAAFARSSIWRAK